MIPAMPKYVGEHFEDTPPGHKYNLYLRYKWEYKEGGNSKDIVEQIIKPFPQYVYDQTRIINERFNHLLNSNPRTQAHQLTICAKSVSPFVTGLGIDHPLENGFAFLLPYGLPYLPGSSIKGVLRTSWRELHDDQWVDELFGTESQTDSRRGALTFWDCIPEVPAPKGSGGLRPEIMTPHYSQYYKGKESPHDAGTPIPILFMTVPPNSKFVFHASLNKTLLKSMDSSDGEWKNKLQEAFEYAFEWIGFGAKTSLGYGAMAIEIREEKKGNGKNQGDGGRKGMTDFERLIDAIVSNNQGENAHISVLYYFNEVGFDLSALPQGQIEHDVLNYFNKVGSEKLKISICDYLKKQMQEKGDWNETGDPKKNKSAKRTQIFLKLCKSPPTPKEE